MVVFLFFWSCAPPKLFGALPHTSIWGYAPQTRRTGLCSPNPQFLSYEKKGTKDSLGEVSPKTPLLSYRLPKNRMPVRFLSDSTQRHIFLKTKTVTCHRCSLLQDRKVRTYPLRICSPKNFSEEDTYKTADFLLRNANESRIRGSRDGEGVFLLSAGSLETRGFALCGYGAHSPIKKDMGRYAPYPTLPAQTGFDTVRNKIRTVSITARAFPAR